MKKSLMLCSGFFLVFLFIQILVFAAESGPVITNVKATPFAFSSMISFNVNSSLSLVSCSVYLNSSNKSFQQKINETNTSGVNRIKMVNLSESTSYQGKVSCFDSNNNLGESSVFNFMTPAKNSSSSNNSTSRRNNTSTSTTANNSSIVSPPLVQADNSSSSSMKRFVLGVSIGLGIIFIVGAVGYLLWKSRKN